MDTENFIQTVVFVALNVYRMREMVSTALVTSAIGIKRKIVVYRLEGEERMFNIGMPELLIILAIALIVFGPNKLPELARAFGRAMREFKKATEEVKQSFEAETRDLDELKSTLHEEKEKFLDHLADESSETHEHAATPSEVVTESSMPSESSGPLETPSVEAGLRPTEGEKAEPAKKAEPQG